MGVDNVDRQSTSRGIVNPQAAGPAYFPTFISPLSHLWPITPDLVATARLYWVCSVVSFIHEPQLRKYLRYPLVHPERTTKTYCRVISQRVAERFTVWVLHISPTSLVS